MRNSLSIDRLRWEYLRRRVRRPNMLLVRFYSTTDKKIKFTISAASVPAIENSRSAYFFQYPNSRGNLARNRSYAFRTVVIACGLELRLIPPSRASAPRASFSQISKLSGSSTCRKEVSRHMHTTRANASQKCLQAQPRVSLARYFLPLSRRKSSRPLLRTPRNRGQFR